MIVLDASAAVEWLLGRPLAGKVAERLADPDEMIHAPHLLVVEVAQVVRRYVHSGAVDPRRGGEAITDLAGLDLVCHDQAMLLPRIWELRDNVTAYDAAYLALAELLDAPVVTLDARLTRSRGHTANVEVVGSS